MKNCFRCIPGNHLYLKFLENAERRFLSDKNLKMLDFPLDFVLIIIAKLING